jgi:CDP-glycerol glycerophosphotransferase
VSGFSFASGNAKKLLSLPLYALGSFASAVVKRQRGRWVFGCGIGVGEGALELYRLVHADPSIRAVWLARNESDLKAAEALGIAAELKDSPRGFWLTLRAEVAVVTHGFGDVNRYGNRGVFLVQLWHGIPLKLIQLDSPVTTALNGVPGARFLRGLLRRAYRRSYQQISLMPAASTLVADRLKTAFALTDHQVVVTGDPRDDVLAKGTPADRVERARLLLAENIDLNLNDSVPRTILYAPTWREGDPDPGAPTPNQWSRLDAYLLASDSLLILRPHPHGLGDYEYGLGSMRVQLLSAKDQPDVTPILPAISLLVTDYSSIAFDYSLTGGPILFLAADEDTYTATRGLYEPYRDFSGDNAATSWDSIIDQLEGYDRDPVFAAAIIAHSEALRARHFSFTDGRNTERVLAQISQRLGNHE